MPMGQTAATDFLKLRLNATAIADIAENDATSPDTQVYLGFHTAAVGDAGDQTTNEATYTGYARTAIARTTGGFTCASGVATNAAQVTAPTSSSGPQTLYFWSLGKASAGAGKIEFWGALASAKPIPFRGAASDTVTAEAHGCSVNDPIWFQAVPGRSLPTGITEGTVYFVKTAPDADTMTISTTAGGATLDITADGDGLVQRIDKAITINNNIAPQLAIGALSIAMK